MNTARALAVVLVAIFSSLGYADEALEARLAKRLKAAIPDAEVTAITPSSVAGIYEVMLGPSLLYMTADGRFVFRGDIYDLDDMSNVTAARRGQARAAAFEDIEPENAIEFAPTKGQVRHVLYVFTDIDCAYCRKLHKEVNELNAAGIAIRYLAFPRSGIDSESYDKAVSVWCGKDPRQALTDAKLGKGVKKIHCKNPVASQFELGQAMGVRGTPAVYSADGHSIGGYIPAGELIRLLESGEI